MARTPLCLIVVLAMLAGGWGLELSSRKCPPNVDCDSYLLKELKRRLNINSYRPKDEQTRRHTETDEMETSLRGADTTGEQRRHDGSGAELPTATGGTGLGSSSGLNTGKLTSFVTYEFMLLEYLRERLIRNEFRLDKLTKQKAQQDAEIAEIVEQKAQQDAEIAEIVEQKAEQDAEIAEMRTEIARLTASGGPGAGSETGSPAPPTPPSPATPAGSGGGGLYTRWGKTSCPGNGTEIVYSGFTGGGLYTHAGSAAEYVCLPPDPLWGNYNDAVEKGGYMYGAEYQTTATRVTLMFGENVYDYDVPCAVCRVSSRPTVLMIPGRNRCYDGWHQEYAGYLMTQYYASAAAGQYVCVDAHPEGLHASHRDDNGKLLYFVEGSCGSLRCPPYVNGRELTCAVCSK